MKLGRLSLAKDDPLKNGATAQNTSRLQSRLWNGGKKKRTKISIWAIVIAVGVSGFFLTDYLISVQRYKNMVENITYENMDASHIPNGTYSGECDAQFIYAKVEVTVENGRITDIQVLEHRHERGAAANGIEQRIIDKQMVDVDAVSGATNSSKIIKKAVDNALSSAYS